jgi:DNA primase
MEGKVALLPAGHDPDTFIRQEGLDALNSLVHRAEPLAEFILAQLIRQHGLTLSGKSRIVEELLPVIKEARSSLQRSMMISHFGDKLGIPPEQIAASLSGDNNPIQIQKPVSYRKRDSLLSPAQRRLAGFMVMYPMALPNLESAGIRAYLAGGIGEILFLLIKSLLQNAKDVQPEDLLSGLPDGPEHDFVTEMLLKASSLVPNGLDGEDLESEIAEIIEWLKIEELKQESNELLQKITDIQGSYGAEDLDALLLRKQKVDRELRGLEE